MTNHTATVEALTAEVRVLMVGSRQVTMSVYGQLDHVNYDEIEPFGRVLPKDAQRGYVYVIGKRAGHGDLVSSWLPCTEQGITRLIAGRSRAAACERDAEREDERAAQCLKTAAELEKTAAELLGDGWLAHRGEVATSNYGAGHHAAEAAEHEQLAEEAEREVSRAEDEITRLGALADAARHRHLAASKRNEAERARAESATLRVSAQGCRDREPGHRANAEAHLAAALELADQDSREEVAVTETASAWSALPLIVLAGLR